MKYNYDVKQECFIREDGLGKKLWINSVEAQRIMTLYNLGNSYTEIRNKITFRSNKVANSTIRNFIKNVEEGDIIIPTDVPVPAFDSLTIEERITKLENDLMEFKEKYLRNHECKCDSKESNSMMDKLRGLWNE